ncbi:ParB/RepB/Spo0J family partition protein [Rheinheimera sp.]|uniref:ParB/RepB/Spo0J family partition protein n=1 Tax=Rheinheimera sp. TaxID=1869214 RepID=UPI00307EFC7E
MNNNTEALTSSVTMASVRRRVEQKADALFVVVAGKKIPARRVVIPHAEIEEKTFVFNDNERIQRFLNPKAVADILPSITESGIDKDATARENNGRFEVADGSRRRYTAILAGQDYPMLVADLTDEQMLQASRTGNNYKTTSEYEKGHTHQTELLTMNVSQCAEKNNVHRNIITRRVKTASLPDNLVACFPTLNDLSARMGADIYDLIFADKDVLRPGATAAIAKVEAEKQERELEPDDVLAIIKDAMTQPKPGGKVEPEAITPNVKIKHDADKGTATFQMKNADPGLVEEIKKLVLSWEGKQ